MSGVTVCLLNYRRTANYQQIIPALASQNIPVKIFLWNNGEPFRGDEPFLRHIDWLVESNHNRKCWPRWLMASQAETDFVCSWDDDLLPLDKSLFSDVLEAYEKLDLHGAVGPFGVQFVAGELYGNCQHLKADKITVELTEKQQKIDTSTEAGQRRRAHAIRNALRSQHIPVDMIKGRHLLLPAEKLRQAELTWHSDSTVDDIIVCGKVAAGRALKHNVLAIYQHRFAELDFADEDLSIAISRQQDHLARRQRARELFFPGL